MASDRINDAPEKTYKVSIINKVADWYKDFNEYKAGRLRGCDSIIDVFDIVDSDFVNYKLPTFNVLSGISCTFKCGHDLCQNSSLCKQTIIRCNIDDIINRYLSQDIAKSITFQGLEPLDNMKQLLWFIYHFRKKSNDNIIIWTGYTKEECEDLILFLRYKMKFKNIIIKFGRFIPNSNSRYDDVLGITLVSDNQYAEKIS